MLFLPLSNNFLPQCTQVHWSFTMWLIFVHTGLSEACSWRALGSHHSLWQGFHEAWVSIWWEHVQRLYRYTLFSFFFHLESQQHLQHFLMKEGRSFSLHFLVRGHHFPLKFVFKTFRPAFLFLTFIDWNIKNLQIEFHVLASLSVYLSTVWQEDFFIFFTFESFQIYLLQVYSEVPFRIYV